MRRKQNGNTWMFAGPQNLQRPICRANQDVIIDRLITLTPGNTLQTIALPELPDDIEIWIFDECGGSFLLYEQSNFIRQVEFTMGVQGHSLEIEVMRNPEKP